MGNLWTYEMAIIFQIAVVSLWHYNFGAKMPSRATLVTPFRSPPNWKPWPWPYVCLYVCTAASFGGRQFTNSNLPAAPTWLFLFFSRWWWDYWTFLKFILSHFHFCWNFFFEGYLPAADVHCQRSVAVRRRARRIGRPLVFKLPTST